MATFCIIWISGTLAVGIEAIAHAGRRLGSLFLFCPLQKCSVASVLSDRPTRPYDQTFYAEVGDTSWDEMPDEEVFAAAEAAKADLGF